MTAPPPKKEAAPATSAADSIADVAQLRRNVKRGLMAFSAIEVADVFDPLTGKKLDRRT